MLRVADVDRPAPKDDDVLSRRGPRLDRYARRRGLRNLEYLFSRLMTGIRRPKRTISAMEFAGLVMRTSARP